MRKLKEEKTVDDEPKYVSIIYIGMGTTWLVGSKDLLTAVECVRMMKQDWGHLFKFKKNDAYPVHLYKLNAQNMNNGWESSHGIIRDATTQKELPFHKTFWVVK